MMSSALFHLFLSFMSVVLWLLILGIFLRKAAAPKLKGRLHFAVGMRDNYYLEQAVYLTEERMKALSDPSNSTVCPPV